MTTQTPVISFSYCCSKCGKCFEKSSLRIKVIKGNREIIVEYFCPECGRLLVREIISP